MRTLLKILPGFIALLLTILLTSGMVTAVYDIIGGVL